MQLTIIKRNGQTVEYDKRKIRTVIKKALFNSKKRDGALADQLVETVHKQLNGSDTYTTDQIHNIVEKTLMSKGHQDTAKAYILYRGKKKEIYDRKKEILNVDYLDDVAKIFSENSLMVLESRYLRRNDKGEIIETPEELFTRTATVIGIADLIYDKEFFDINGDYNHPKEGFEKMCQHPHSIEISIGKYKFNQYHVTALLRAYDRLSKQMRLSICDVIQTIKEGKMNKYEKNIDEYKYLMTSQKFMPNSPTLYNAGARLGQLSACFVLGIEDDLGGIMETAKNTAMIFQSGGGVGINYSSLREGGGQISSTSGKASGPVSFMEIINTITDVVKQGGKRRGANMGILNIDHPDIENFINNKTEAGKLENFNVSVLVDDKFWDALENNKPYHLKSPKDGRKIREIKPQNLFNMVALSAWKSAEPGLIFKDNANEHNVYGNARGGPLTTTNPCIPADSWVYTSTGIHRMGDLYDRQEMVEVEVNSRKQNGSIKPRKISQIIAQGEKPVFKLITKEGYELRCTEDHKIWTERGWVKAKDLEEDDKIHIMDHEGGFGNKGSYDLGASMGWLIGDGTLNKNIAVLGFFHEKRELAPMFAEMVNNIVPEPAGLRKHYNISTVNIKGRNETRVSSSRLCTVMKECGLVNGNKHIVPDVVYQGTRQMQKGFLTALFSADGSMIKKSKHANAQIRLTSISLPLLKGVQKILLNFGIASKLYRNRKQAGRKLFPLNNGKGEYKMYDVKACHEIAISKTNAITFAKEIGFIQNDKQELFLEQLKSYTKGAYKENYMVRFSELVPDGTEQVFDLTEPKTHSFICDGISISNCGEQLLYPNESCNLGSINVSKFVKAGKFNWDKFEETIRKTTRFLDAIMDVNVYPLDSIEKASIESRRIGLGVMGVADALYKLKIQYNSKEGFEMMSKMAETLSYYSMLESIELAKERGSFPLFPNTEYPEGKLPLAGAYSSLKKTYDWKEMKNLVKEGIRNVLTTTVAPTGSISMIADCSSGMEPTFALCYTKKVAVGDFTYMNKLFENVAEVDINKLKRDNGSIQNMEDIPEDIRNVFVIAADINWKDHLRAQAAWQKWIGNAISKTINMPAETTVEDVKGAYMMAHDLGLKGITLYRDGSRHKQVLNTRPTCECGGNLVDQDGCQTCMSCGKSMCTVA